MKRVPALLFGLTFFLIGAHRMPAPIHDVPESATTPALEKQAKPKKRPSRTKAAESELRTKSETKASVTRPPQGPARSAKTHSSSSRRDVGGTPDGSTFGITEVKATETPDPEAETNLTLRIGIRKQPNVTIDATKVKIQVFFYETVDNKDIELTDADVNYEWVRPKHDWAITNPEILSVNYMRPKWNRSHPMPHFLRRQQRSNRYKGIGYERQVQWPEAVSANIWDTEFWSITMVNCKPLRQNRHGYYSFFLLQRIPRYRDVIARHAS